MNKIFKNDIYYIIAGTACMFISIVLGWINSDISSVNFLRGVFAGISIPLNIFGIYKISRNIKNNNTKK